MTESCGPGHAGVGQRCRAARTAPARRSSARGCACRSRRSTLPSSRRASAIFSLVASAWKSTTTIGVSRRSSSTSCSATENGCDLRVHEQPAHEVEHRDRACRRARGDDAAPRPGAPGPPKFAGRSTRSLRLEQRVEISLAPDVIPGRHDVGATLEQAARRAWPSGPRRRPRSRRSRRRSRYRARGGARAAVTRSRACPARRRRRRRREASRCGPQAYGSGRLTAGRTSMWTWCAAILGVTRRAPDVSTEERSRSAPIFVRAAATVEPTVSAGSGSRFWSETTRPGLPEGWMSIRTPCCSPATIRGEMPITVPFTGA